jgi:hypothetical protein
MSTQTVDALELVLSIHSLIQDTIKNPVMAQCDRKAMLFAYNEVLHIVIELCNLEGD